ARCRKRLLAYLPDYIVSCMAGSSWLQQLAQDSDDSTTPSRAETRPLVGKREDFRLVAHFFKRDGLFGDELLRAPRHHFRAENGMILIDCERMRIEMAAFVRRWPVQRAHNLAVAIDFQDPASDCVGHVDKMIGRDKETKRMAQLPFA